MTEILRINFISESAGKVTTPWARSGEISGGVRKEERNLDRNIGEIYIRWMTVVRVPAEA
eukprot:3179964-Pleurochrysis_carterae.AAC.1